MPLAIVLIGGYLRLYPEVSFQDYYEVYVKNKLGSIDLDEINPVLNNTNIDIPSDFKPKDMFVDLHTNTIYVSGESPPN